jgi:YD repeat-containing protein
VKPLLFGLLVLALIGCNSVKPVGILSKEPPPLAQQGKPLPTGTEQARPPTIRPTPPTTTVTPEQVDPANPYIAAGRLTAEVDADSRSLNTAPVTAEVSRIRGGVRQP